MAEKRLPLAPACMDLSLSLCGGTLSPTEYCSAYPSCHETVESCCDEDTCSAECSSVCDGLVACDASTICSEMLCDSQDCQNTTPVCFDQNCIGDGTVTVVDDGMCDMLNPNGSFSWNSEGFLDSENTTTPVHHHPFHHPPHDTPASVCPSMHSVGPLPPSEPSLVAKNYAFQYHQDQSCSSLPQATLTESSNSPGSNIDHTINLCSTLDNCNHESHFGPVFSDCNPDEFLGFIPMEFHEQFHSIYSQLYPRFDGGLMLPCELQPEHVHKNTSRSLQPPHRPPSSSVCSAHSTSSPSLTPPLQGSDITTPLATPLTTPLTSPDVEQTNELYICKCIIKTESHNTTCGASFLEASKLQEHLIHAHVGAIEGPQGHGFYCCWEGCHRPNEPFSQKSKLQGHFLTHSNHKGFQCSTCAKCFARQATLERHERSHRGEKPYVCKLCQKAFTDSSELKTHMRIHTGEKPFKCNFPGCSFETGDSSNMSSHKLTHGVRKHKCNFPGCSKSFTRPDQLKRHMKTTHKVNTNSSVSVSPPAVRHFPLAQFQPPSARSPFSFPYQTVAIPMATE
ncbi:zinc-responsiveness transcriptional activator [Histoplasma ohiense]|nr:zinc-responsiveness transcriptional activator [Histoplasma ohiense (nom. inval.)]